MDQQPLFPQIKGTPASLVTEGFRYRSDFITETEELALVAALSQLPLKPFEFHGYLGNRRTLSFGLRYDHSHRGVELAAPPPPILDAVRVRVAEFAGHSPEEFRQIGINEYRPGAGIGWHRDKPEFGDVVGISLLSAVRMRFRKRNGKGWLRAAHLLEPRSVYIFTGEVRHQWEHSIAPVSSLRYSLTFRTLASEASTLLAAS